MMSEHWVKNDLSLKMRYVSLMGYAFHLIAVLVPMSISDLLLQNGGETLSSIHPPFELWYESRHL